MKLLNLTFCSILHFACLKYTRTDVLTELLKYSKSSKCQNLLLCAKCMLQVSASGKERKDNGRDAVIDLTSSTPPKKHVSKV